MYTHYVAGFLFSEDLERVALIRKQRPDWQKGKLNGIGGRIQNEPSSGAMQREYLEETGHLVKVGTQENEWKFFLKLTGVVNLTGDGFAVNFYRAKGDLSEVRTRTDEEVIVIRVEDLHSYETLPNVKWIIPMALSFYRGERCHNFRIDEI